MIDMRYRGVEVAIVGGPFDGAIFHSADPISWPVYLDDNATPVGAAAGYAALTAGTGYFHWFRSRVHA
ncbi:MAG TPA: hypothetical protein VGH76_25215, partial [Actinomycetospora sp.]|uniref:hypothetical protein n=1 Tax=Actinomycetospora sp. TaxID=1872135 RepID=UPI002F40D5E9